jgi:hypothetical protein
LGYRCFVPRDGGLREFLVMDESSADTNFFFLHGQRHLQKLKTVLRP